MYILVTDETNATTSNSNPNDYFISGGLILSSEKIFDLHKKIGDARRTKNYQSRDLLKFETNSKQLKNDVIDICKQIGGLLITVLTPHTIATDPKQKYQWNHNQVVGKYHKFLLDRNVWGICMCDPIEGARQHFAELFQNGLYISRTNKSVPLPNIVAYTTAHIESSHLMSALDVVLGAFRWSVNNFKSKNTECRDIAQALLVKISDLIWCDATPTYPTETIQEFGLTVRPMGIEKQRPELQEIINFIETSRERKEVATV